MKKKRIKGNTPKSEEEKEASMGEGLQIGDTEVIAHKSQSSVTIKKDSKGVTSFELKVYDDNIDVAAMLAVKHYEELEGELGHETEEDE